MYLIQQFFSSINNYFDSTSNNLYYREYFQYIKKRFIRVQYIKTSIDHVWRSLSGLCKMSVHWEKVNLDKNTFIESMINTFGIKWKNLYFLFSVKETE